MTQRVCAGPAVALAMLLATAAGPGWADDWPQMQGPGRDGVWHETGILRQFPAEGLTVRWRTPLLAGYSGAAVAGGRVFVGDYQRLESGGQERVLCLDEASGRVLWIYTNPEADYKRFAYNSGPRATPTVNEDRVFFQGAAGDLYCLSVVDGALLWSVNLARTFKAKIPTWGFSCAPLVWDELVLCAVGGENARLVALKRTTGETVWASLAATSDIGYSPPVIVSAGGVEQLIHWNFDTLTSVDPATGALYWELPYGGEMSVATPVVDGDRLLVSGFYGGSMMVRLATDAPTASVLWHRKGANEVNTDSLHALMCTPAMEGGYFYGVCSHGQFRCIDASTGERVWESPEVTVEKARWANAFITRNAEVYFLNNDRGELIVAQLTPEGYRELDRTKLIEPTSGGAGGRELKAVNWVLPAYANGHILIRNDKEILSASLRP